MLLFRRRPEYFLHLTNRNHRSALSGLLFALAMALSFIEGTLVIPGLAPGMKLGLANIVVMYALFFMGARQALYLDLLKALFVFLVSGWTAGFLSLCGGLLSLLVMSNLQNIRNYPRVFRRIIWIIHSNRPVAASGIFTDRPRSRFHIDIYSSFPQFFWKQQTPDYMGYSWVR